MQGILSSLLPAQWIALAICALCVGMSKTGVAGIYAVVVPLMAAVFGGKLSTGVLLPILIIGDVFAVIYYHREANWGYIRRLLPWTMAGVLVGTLTGSAISDGTFKIMMAFVILSGIAVMFLMDLRKQQDIPAHPAIGAATGLLGGFATMIGNVAGPIMSVYFLSMRLPRDQMIGTGAWFFLIVNVAKIPFQIIGWGNISSHYLLANVLMLPLIALGAVAGVWIVKKIPEKAYRVFVMLATVLSAGLLLI